MILIVAVLSVCGGCSGNDPYLNRPESPFGTQASGSGYVPSLFGAGSPHQSAPPDAQTPSIPPEMIPVYAPQPGLIQPSGYAGTPGGESSLPPEVVAAQVAGAGNGTPGNFGAASLQAGIAPSGFTNASGQIAPYAGIPPSGTTGAAGGTGVGGILGGLAVPAGYTPQQAYAATPDGYMLMAPVYVVDPATGTGSYQYMPVRPAY